MGQQFVVKYHDHPTPWAPEELAQEGVLFHHMGYCWGSATGRAGFLLPPDCWMAVACCLQLQRPHGRWLAAGCYPHPVHPLEQLKRLARSLWDMGGCSLVAGCCLHPMHPLRQLKYHWEVRVGVGYDAAGHTDNSVLAQALARILECK